ncbi:MAG: hypothetical protein DWI24_01015 [Planctomycetota bacterium]|nr:MAG: hypothetical protein DWI24_01015 [Planctomycetota bacterium]
MRPRSAFHGNTVPIPTLQNCTRNSEARFKPKKSSLMIHPKHFLAILFCTIMHAIHRIDKSDKSQDQAR